MKTLEECLIDLKKRYPTAIRELEIRFVSNLINKINIYYRLNNDISILFIAKFEKDSDYIISEYVEVFVDTFCIRYLKKRKWTFKKMKVHKTERYRIISSIYEEGKVIRISISMYLLRELKLIKKNDNVIIYYKNNKNYDFTIKNLEFKQQISSVNEKLNQSIIDNNKNKFRYRYIFDSLEDIPENWKKLYETPINIFYHIAEDVVAIVIKFKYKYFNNKYITTVVDYETYERIKKVRAACIPFRDHRRPAYMVYINLYFDRVHKIKLHRFAMKMDYDESDIFIDHINRDTLDNRKINLRKSDSRFNARNRSVNNKTPYGVLGIRFNKEKQRWVSGRAMRCKLGNKFRSIYSDDYETAVKYRKMLEIISDTDFLTDIPTFVLIQDYKRNHKFDNIEF